MSEYINREKAIEELKAWATNLVNPANLVREDAFYILETMKYIEIVRCKNCLHCADDWNGSQPMFTCELGRCGESVQPNDYCSYGERIEK